MFAPLGVEMRRLATSHRVGLRVRVGFGDRGVELSLEPGTGLGIAQEEGLADGRAGAVDPCGDGEGSHHWIMRGTALPAGAGTPTHCVGAAAIAPRSD